RHPWRPDLAIGSSSHRFQRGLNPLAARSAPGGYKVVAVVVMRENERVAPVSGSATGEFLAGRG
ncbi:hypothetical protein, partial [Citrobacter sp. UYEF32]|uniref:hypothetical protein n=1 Tax=Citrobacter sp. UYEF32 TaxID=3156347 RepID=UPI00339947D3